MKVDDVTMHTRGVVGSLSLLFLLLLPLVAVGSEHLLPQRMPCRLPMSYTVGTIDPRFGITAAQLLDAVDQAAEVWEAAVGRTLFDSARNVPAGAMDGSFRLTMVFDSRHAFQQQLDTLKVALDASLAEFTHHDEGFRVARADFERSDDAHRAAVEQWNARPGSTSDLQELKRQNAALKTELQALNAQGARLNTRIAHHNQLVKRANATIDAFTTRSADQGQQVGAYIRNASGVSIAIYTYSRALPLSRILTHEMGHAFGLAHSTDSASIMHHSSTPWWKLRNTFTQVPTVEDVIALRANCHLK